MGSAVIAAGVGLYLFSYRHVPGTIQLSLLMAAVAEWAAAYAMEFKTAGLAGKLFWVRMEYFGGAWTGLFFLVFILFITGHERWLTRHRTAMLAVVPTMTPILAWTNDWHHLMWRSAWLDTSGPAAMLAYDRGPAFWIFVGASYLMLLAGTIVLIHTLRGARLMYRRQLQYILAAVMAPWLGNVLYLFEKSPLPHLDLTPMAFTVSGVACAIGLFRHRLLDIVPLARAAIMEAIGDGVLVIDRYRRLVDCNASAQTMLGVDAAAATGQQLDYALPQFGALVLDHLGDYPVQVEVAPDRPTGSGVFNLRISPLVGRTGRCSGWLAVFQDITGCRQAEAALRDSEERFRSISANAMDAIVMTDAAGRISFWNRAAERMFGFAEHEILGRPVERIVPGPSDRGWSSPVGRSVEMAARRKDGQALIVEMSVAPLTIKNQPHAVGIIRDITERSQQAAEYQRLQQQLQCAQKMEALGTLAGGVAHDLNNILSGIVSYPDLLLMRIPDDSPLRKPIETMQASGQKAAAIVQDLLTLARRNVATSEVVDLNDVVTGYLESPEFAKLKAFHPKVKVDCRLAPVPAMMKGSPVHLSKTVMNLISNAAEAMSEGGPLTITTDHVCLEGPLPGHPEAASGEHIVLTVKDRGVGISAAERERIFDPFYTKKVMGRSGTGLGMTVVWGTVQDHGGHIKVDSQPGHGTCITIRFPATGGLKAPRAKTESLDVIRGRGESILVVDDAPEQRDILCEMLDTLGYHPTAVSSGEAAAAHVEKNPPDLLILDMLMEPGLDGLETYKTICRRRPGQRAIIASGYSQSTRVREAQRMGVGQYVSKPYTLQKIGTAVRAELDRAETSGPGGRCGPLDLGLAN